MRAIKVRIWDGKKYHYPECTKEEANHYLQLGSEGFWLYNEQGKMITASEVGGVCEEFTGLLDKAGKEIYEGDVVLFADNNIQHEVTFEEGGFRLKEVGGRVLVYNIKPSIVQVVGNIRETPKA